ncbi:MAG: hypothetical protein GY943_09845 [Chloroflexi bacterium]|nr:hypothetical protein [Chloroflexota bacterium]
MNIQKTGFGFDIFRRQRTLIYIVHDFTCARGWKGALQLKSIYPQLQAAQTAVSMLGNGRFHQPAQQLATQLQLPFPVATISNDSQISTNVPTHGDNMILLIEPDNHVSYYRFAKVPDTAVHPSQLLTAIHTPSRLPSCKIIRLSDYLTKDVINTSYAQSIRRIA